MRTIFILIIGIVLVIVGAGRKGPHGRRSGAGTAMLVIGIALIIFFLFGFIALMLGIG
jgi:hypothetical protein